MIHNAEKKLIELLRAQHEFARYRGDFEENPVRFIGADEFGKCRDSDCDCQNMIPEVPKKGGLVSQAGLIDGP